MGLEEAPSGFLLTTIEDLAGYLRKASVWPVTFGLACCAIEMMTTGAPRYDLARFGMEVFRASPRQADLMIGATIIFLTLCWLLHQRDVRVRTNRSQPAPTPVPTVGS